MKRTRLPGTPSAPTTAGPLPKARHARVGTRVRPLVFLLLTASLCAGVLAAQSYRGLRAATVVPGQPVTLKAGSIVKVPLTVQIRGGYHINSNQPNEDYLIPTRLTWNTASLEAKDIEYPDAEQVTYEFSGKPLSVYSGRIVIRTTFQTPSALPGSLKELTGKLRYQACNDKACLPPKTVDVSIPVL